MKKLKIKSIRKKSRKSTKNISRRKKRSTKRFKKRSTKRKLRNNDGGQEIWDSFYDNNKKNFDKTIFTIEHTVPISKNNEIIYDTSLELPYPKTNNDMIRIKNYRYGIYPINIVNITPSPIKSVIPTTTSTIKSEFGFDVQLRTWLTNKKNIVNIYKILDDAIDYYEKKIISKEQRNRFLNNISWSIPSETNISDIVRFINDKNCPYILEIGSGLGLWASILKNTTDITVHATDDFSWYKDKSTDKFYTDEIENINYKDAIKKYNDENSCLFLCWPPPKNDLAKYCLENFKGL